MSSVEVFLPHLTFYLGEGLLKPDDRNELYWVDINGRKICYYNFDRKIYSDYEMPDQCFSPSAIFETNLPNQFFVASNNCISLWDQSTNQIIDQIIFDEIDPTNSRFNDGKLDPNGNLFIGTLDIYDRPNRSALYRLDLSKPDEPIRTEKPNEPSQTSTPQTPKSYFAGAKLTKVLDCSLSNGLGWSLDGTKFYYVDTPTKSIQIFNYQQKTAEIIKPAIDIIDLSGYNGVPDGLTIHPESGNIFVAMWEGASILEINLKKLAQQTDDTRNAIKTHWIKAYSPTNCTFIDNHRLIITTAQKSGDTKKNGKLFQLHLTQE